MLRRFLASSTLAAVALVLVARAEDPIKPKKADPAADLLDPEKKIDPTAIKDQAAYKQEVLARQFREFEQNLLRVAQRMERSSKQEDRDRAAVLKKAIELAGKEGIDTRFDKLVTLLKTSKIDNLQEVKDLIIDADKVAKDLRAMLAILLTDNKDALLKAERERLQNLIKELDKIIREQKVVRAQTEAGKMEKGDLGKNQNKVRSKTEDLAKAMGGKGNDGAGKEAKGAGKGEGKGKEGKGEGKNDTKESKSGQKEEKGGTKESKSGEKKSEDKQGQAEGKKGDGSKGQGEGKGQGQKSGESGKGEGKGQGEGKGKGDGKGEGKGGKGKGEGEGKGQGKGQGQGQGQGQSKSDGQSGNQGNPNQNPNQPNSDNTPGKKQVQDATQDQQKAEDNINKEKKDNASKNQDDAIKKLEEARKRLEELLRQIREEEIERLLAQLQKRCERMLQMQIGVYEDTKRVDKQINENADKKPNRANEQKAVQLSDREGEIVKECSQARSLVKEEGSAVAFAEVFDQVYGDMVNVQRRLGRADVAKVTQVIEEEIIATLKEMIEALKKARQENQANKGQPPPPGPPPPQRLIDLLAELKMIRSMQIRVNGRTKTYATQYTGEQADDPDIQKELKDLSNRQQKIFQVTKDIATKKNE